MARQVVEKHNELSVFLALAEFLENNYLGFPALPSSLRNYMLFVQEEVSKRLGRECPIYRTDLCSHKELLPEDVEEFGRGYIAYWRNWQCCHRVAPTPGHSRARQSVARSSTFQTWRRRSHAESSRNTVR